MNSPTLKQVTATIYDQLVALSDLNVSRAELAPTTHLIEDLGLDSLKFVDLTVSLEETFGIDEFPMQEWVDSEAAREGPRFTVLALAMTCVSELERMEGAGRGPE